MPTPQTTPPTPNPPVHGSAVLLIHTTPDHTAHLDWMIERPAPLASAPAPGHRLQTFRTVAAIHRPPHTPFLAQPIPDHRDRYLTFEGPISNNRGRVDRLATASIIAHAPDAITLAWHAGPTVRYRFTRPNSAANDRFILVLPEPIMASGTAFR